MIKKIKIVSILVSLSLMISIFFGCTAEEQVIKEHSHSQDTKLTKVPLSELMLQAKFSTAYKKIPKKKVVKYDIAGRSVLEDQFGFTILDAPVNVIEKDGQTYYNILIVSDNNTDNKIENLIISSLTNQDNEFYQVKYKATNTTVNALDVIEQGVEDIINLETQNSTDTNRCSFYEVTSYYCTAAGTAQDCEGSDTQSGCHGTTTMTMSCSGGSGFNYGNPSGNGSTSSNGGSNGGSNGTIIGSPVVPPCTTCPTLKFAKPENCAVKNKLQNDDIFKNQMSALLSSARSASFETAKVLYNKPNPTPTDNFSYVSKNGTPTSPIVIYDANTDMQAVLHNHYGDLCSIFSAQDLQDLYIKLKNYPQITDNIFLGLVTSKNTAYLLQIENRDAFIAFGDEYLSTEDQIEDFMQNKMAKKYNIYGNGDSATNEAGFYKMMNDLNMGVLLSSPPPILPSATPSPSMFDTWNSKAYSRQTRKAEPINCN